MAKHKNVKKNNENGQKENMIAKCRKRKATDQLQPFREKRKCEMNDNETEKLLRELGVDALSSEQSDSNSSFNEFTPETNSKIVVEKVPMAPRVLQPHQGINICHQTPTNEQNKCQVKVTQPLCLKPCPKKNKLEDYIIEDLHPSNGFDYFSTLSDEIILCIFHWLPKFTLSKCSRVCKRWNHLACDDSLWRRIDLSSKVLSGGTLGIVLNRGVQILRMAKTEVEGPAFSGPTSLLHSTRLSRVQYLDLSMSNIDTPTLSELFSVCRDLKKVSLELCHLNDEVCQNLAENRNLETINFTMCEGISSAGLMPIASNCRKLESLNLAWTGLQRHSIVYLSLCLPPSVQKLNISGMRTNITDEDVLQLCKTCPNLKELDISDCTVLTCQTLEHLAAHLTKLEYVAISRCYRVVPSSVLNLAKINTLLAVDIFGMLRESALQQLKTAMGKINVNSYLYSSIARPTIGTRRTSIWGMRVRD